MIFKTSTSPLFPISRFSGIKSQIWLNIALYSVKLVFVIGAVFLPLTTHAGVFSFVSDFVGGKEAGADINMVTSQTMGLLQANLGPSATSPIAFGDIAIVDGSALIQEAGIIGTQADIVEARSTQISLYVVRQGDSLAQIAKMFGVSVNTIVWANTIKGSIHEGDELIILPISGINHIVKKGDTIRSLASKYRADMGDIISYNSLNATNSLVVGTSLVIPDGELQTLTSSVAQRPTSALHGAGGPVYKDFYIRPIAGGRKSQSLHGYNAVDLAAPTGTPVYAAADGLVIIARSYGYNGGYGQYIVVAHGNGTQTLYAHMNKVFATQGSYVSKGDTIGLLGNSGNSTGPHVHFEIRGAANPF